MDNSGEIIHRIGEASHRLHTNIDLDPLLEEIGDARFVLLGEASHGTHEYYTWRTRITRRLLEEKGFSFVAVEGDWPDCYRINRYVKGYEGSGTKAVEVLLDFARWPTWMWANWEVAALIEWMRGRNESVPPERKAGFYGLDVYSLWESLEAITTYLREHDPASLENALRAMECFEPHNVQEGFANAGALYGSDSRCRDEVEQLLLSLRQRPQTWKGDPESAFSAEQNALVAVNAEKYYHVMLRGGDASWNVRDRHMAETLDRLIDFYGPQSKAIIWEHNTHIGDARATDMARAGLVNVGQLVKEKYDQEGVVRVGFGSYGGNVLAARRWGDRVQQMPLPDAVRGSWEWLLHEASATDKLLLTKDLRALTQPIGHRAVGVVYHPESERGNYVPSIIPERYEAFIYLEHTKALHALHNLPDSHLVPDTWPWGE